MNSQAKADLTQLLSAYIDGELNAAQSKSVEALLAQDPAARREADEMKALRSFLKSKRRIPASAGLWTRVSTAIEQKKREQDNLLPFPRKYQPIVAAAALVVVLVAVVVVFVKRDSVVDYVSKQSERVQKAVEENVLKGSLMPLFSHVDKNQALQFAMFGVLPLDANAGTQLRVKQDSVRGYTIDLDTKGGRKTPPVTVKEFVDVVKPTHGQLQIIDSLLDLGRRKLEGSVLMAEDRAMAVNPELSNLDRVMLSGIAASLGPEQRDRFDRFLRDRKATYVVTGGRGTPVSPDRIFHSMRIPRQYESFVVMTPDTALVSRVRIDMDSLRRHFQEFGEMQTATAVNMSSLIRRMAEREAAFRRQFDVPAPDIRISGDSESFSIQFNSGWEGVPEPSTEMWVRPRIPSGVRVGRGSGRAETRFHYQYSGPDSSFSVDLNLDSILQQLQREGGIPGLEFFRQDPGGKNRVWQADPRTMRRTLDSALRIGRRSSPKLDSLMRQMERRDQSRTRENKELDPNQQYPF